jgi:hypothetical protein
VKIATVRSVFRKEVHEPLYMLFLDMEIFLLIEILLDKLQFNDKRELLDLYRKKKILNLRLSFASACIDFGKI